MKEVHVVVPDGIDDPQRPSGGNIYDRRACLGLEALGWRVHEHPVPGRWPLVDPTARAAVAAVLSRVPTDALVVIDGLVASVVPELLAPEAHRLRLVVLVHMPRGDPREHAALAAACAIVVTSRWTRRLLSDTYGLPAGLVHVVPPGVDAAELAPGTPSGGQLICVAAVTPVKGHDVLLDALSSVDDHVWRCVCVGSLEVDALFAADVRRRSQDGFCDRVSFPGALTGGDLARAYEQADVLVLASRSETYGMVVTEALALGLPVIATDVGGVPEALGSASDGSRPGLLVPTDDPQALARALRHWLSDPRERERLRMAARSRRRTLVDWPQTAGRLSDVLMGVAKDRRMNHRPVSHV